MMGLDDWDTEMTEPGSNKRTSEERIVSVTRRRIDVPVTPPGAGPYRVTNAYQGYARDPTYAAYPPPLTIPNADVPRLPHSYCLADENEAADQDMGPADTRLRAVTNKNKKKHIRAAHDEF